jgi:ABC-type multidrug transport system ATPase subunit
LPEVPWIFLDEPTLGQADEAVSELACMLAKEAEAGRGIIIVSHAACLRSHLPGRRLLLVEGQLTVPARP